MPCFVTCKSNWNIPNKCSEFMKKMLLDVTLTNMRFPKCYYDDKRLVLNLGLETKRIDYCVNGCMLFYDNGSGKKDAVLLQCKFFWKSRYHPIYLGSRHTKINCSEVHALFSSNSKIKKKVCIYANCLTHDIP